MKVGVLLKFYQVNLQEGLGVDGRTKLEWILNKYVLILEML